MDNRFLEPFLNLQDEYFPHLAIGDDQFIYAALDFSRLRQITRGKQNAPEVIDAVVDFVVGQFQPNRLLDGFSRNEPLDLALRGLIGFIHETPDQIVSAGVDPVGLGFCVRFAAKSVYVVDHVPWAIHVHAAKAIAVIPFFCFAVMRCQVIIVQERLHFSVCEAEVLVEAAVRDGQHLEVVQPGKNAFLRYAQAARQHRELQVIVRFQRLTEQTANQRDHLFIVAVLERFIQRHVIFVDQEDGLLVVVFIEEQGKRLETGRQHNRSHVILTVFQLQQCTVFFFFIVRQLIALQQK